MSFFASATIQKTHRFNGVKKSLAKIANICKTIASISNARMRAHQSDRCLMNRRN